MKKAKHPNISVTLWDGDATVIIECPGICKLAEYHMLPPDPEDDCMWIDPRDRNKCRNAQAHLDARTAVSELLTNEIKRVRGID